MSDDTGSKLAHWRISHGSSGHAWLTLDKADSGSNTLSSDVMDELEPKLDRVLMSYQDVLREVVAAKQAESGPDAMSDEEQEKVQAFVDAQLQAFKTDDAEAMNQANLRGTEITLEAEDVAYLEALYRPVENLLSIGAS